MLYHPKLKAFMTHCGANSVIEAIYYGKAILGIPRDADQFSNCQKVEDSGVGYHIGMEETSRDIVDRLLLLLNDPSNTILKNVKRTSEIMEFEEVHSQNLLHWINTAITFGSFSHLRLPEGHGLGEWVLLYDVDIICYIILTLYVIYKVNVAFFCSKKRRR